MVELLKVKGPNENSGFGRRVENEIICFACSNKGHFSRYFPRLNKVNSSYMFKKLELDVPCKKKLKNRFQNMIGANNYDTIKSI